MAGVFDVKVNGVSAIIFAGNTTPGPTTINRLQLGSLGWNSFSASGGYFDDVILDDAAWIGNTKIQGVAVNGAGGFAQFNPSTGANYQTVDEIPPSDTDYNETTIADKVDTFAHAALTGSPTSVKCVQVQARGKLIGSPTPVNLKLAINSGATLYLSPNNALNLAVKAVSGLWATDPNTGLPWTVAGVNATEIGYKSAA